MLECSFDSSQPEALLFGHLNPAGLYEELTIFAKLVADEKRLRTNEALARTDSRVRLTAEAPVSHTGAKDSKTLQGLTVVVIHVKSTLFSRAKASSSHRPDSLRVSSSGGDANDTRDRVLKQLLALEERHKLGVDFVMAVQGMRIGELATCALEEGPPNGCCVISEHVSNAHS